MADPFDAFPDAPAKGAAKDDPFAVFPDAPAPKKADKADKGKKEPIGALPALYRSAAQGVSMGFGDELSGLAVASGTTARSAEDNARSLGLPYIPSPIDIGSGAVRMGLEKLLPSLFGGRGNEAYDSSVKQSRDDIKTGRDQYPITSAFGQLGGGIATGLGLSGAGLSATANAINAGRSLPAVMAAGAREGATLGAVAGLGEGNNAGERLQGVATGGVAGGLIGGAAPAVISGIGAVAKPFVAPVMARLRPEEYANKAVSEGLRRSGMTADDIAGELTAARAAGQEGYTVADALGNPGQRMLSTVTRSPNDERRAVVDGLIARQMDQGRRVAGALGDASGSPLTAAQMQEMLTAQRATNAARNYEPVRVDTSAIDVSPAVAAANRSISPAADNLANARGAVPTDLAARSGIEAGERTIRDPIREAVREARSYLASDSATVTNVEKAFRAKTNIDQMIADATTNGRGGVVAELMPVRDALDDALARTSRQYAAARDTYRSDSLPIDAIATGRGMASPRTRVDDNLSTFGAMNPAEQSSARVGYFDPLIARAESAQGTMTNSARPFMAESARRELPAIAAPGQGDILMQRLAREQRMSETAGAALGGSKTADNLADAAEMAKFDPSVFTALSQGRPLQAVMNLIQMGRNEASGLPPRVIEQVARTLVETDPQQALAVLRSVAERARGDQNVRALTNAILVNLSATGAGRAATP
jgi:hypothetical protein